MNHHSYEISPGITKGARSMRCDWGDRKLILTSYDKLVHSCPFFQVMRASIQQQILFIHHEDLPQFKKGGSVVRNSYFWALKAIAAHTKRNGDWEYDPEVWLALQRLLLSFAESGYLGLRETQLEFAIDQEIPAVLKLVATWE